MPFDRQAAWSHSRLATHAAGGRTGPHDRVVSAREPGRPGESPAITSPPMPALSINRSTTPQPSLIATVGRQPLVSIIVPTLNRARFLERCVQSILGQTYPKIECLVMDGGSKDGSVDILQRLAGADPRLRFISEPDKGEVDATNRGMDWSRAISWAFRRAMISM